MARLQALVLAVLAGGAVALPALADSATRVESRDAFVELVSGRELRRFGIALTVTADGDIRGRAFGRDVTGAWKWESGFFCRDLAFGGEPLDYNCQVVERRDGALRFISDRGAGQFADLRLR